MSTRAVLAVLIVILLTAAVVASRRDAGNVAAWLLTAGFLAATAWAGLGVVWTFDHGPEGSMTPELYLTLVTTGLAFTLYFGLRAKAGEDAFGR